MMEKEDSQNFRDALEDLLDEPSVKNFRDALEADNIKYELRTICESIAELAETKKYKFNVTIKVEAK